MPPTRSLDFRPSTSLTYVRAPVRGNHTSVYYEVAELGVLAVRASSEVDDPRGRLTPMTMSLRSSALLVRLAQDQTPLPPGDAAMRDPE